MCHVTMEVNCCPFNRPCGLWLQAAAHSTSQCEQCDHLLPILMISFLGSGSGAAHLTVHVLYGKYGYLLPIQPVNISCCLFDQSA